MIKRDSLCRCCGIVSSLQAHHILPVALFPGRSLDVDNGIALCGHHHTELHRAKLDITLLPTIYASLTSTSLLHEVLCLQPDFQSLKFIPLRPFDNMELLRVIPKNYPREILKIHPTFATEILGLTITKS